MSMERYDGSYVDTLTGKVYESSDKTAEQAYLDGLPDYTIEEDYYNQQSKKESGFPVWSVVWRLFMYGFAIILSEELGILAFSGVCILELVAFSVRLEGGP